MRGSLKLLVLLTALSVSCVLQAEDLGRTAQKIKGLIKNSLADASVGVVVQDANTGKLLYDYQAQKNFTPASTTKLFSAAAALLELGPDFVYETALYYSPASGDVAIKFSGDPTLKVTELYSLLAALQTKSKVIKGDLWIDDTIYQGPLLGHGWTWDSTSWYHAAPVSAIILNKNQFGVTLFSAAAPGSKVEARFDPAYPGATLRKLKTNLIAVTTEQSENICQISAEVDEDNNLKLNGCWPIANEPTHLRLALKNPRKNAELLIREALTKLDLKLNGTIRFGKTPAKLDKIAHHNSEPLHVLLNAVLAHSNNLYAETLLKTLGARRFGVGSFKTGVLAMQRTLEGVTGIDFAKARLFDGSGESRYNLLTAQQLARLLYTMQQETTLKPYFKQALAASGVSGTLQKRFTSFDTKNNIHAKTGSLSGVSALAGYLRTRRDRELIVTIMINGAMQDGPALREFENKLCYYLVNQL